MGLGGRAAVLSLVIIVCVLNTVRCRTVKITCSGEVTKLPDETCVSWKRLQRTQSSRAFFVYVSIWTFLLNVALCVYLISPFISIAYVVRAD